MTDQTPTKAVVPYTRLKELMTSEEIKSRFAEILGKKSAGFMASILNTVYLDNNLREADPNSIITAAMTAAILDLPVDKNLGFAWIIPYREKNGPQKARFQMGYKGYIQLAIRTAQYTDLNVTEIYQGEQVKVDRLTGRVVLNGNRSGDEVIGYCAYMKLLNGFEKFVYWTIEQVETHAKKYSQSYGSNRSTWTTAPHEMGKKTVIAAMLRKYGLLSIEMQHAMTQDEDITHGEEPLPFAREIVDAEPEPTPEEVTGSFDPAAVLVEAGVSPDIFAARGLLDNYVPEEMKSNQATLVAWGKAYRSWRDAGLTASEAKAKADAGELSA